MRSGIGVGIKGLLNRRGGEPIASTTECFGEVSGKDENGNSLAAIMCSGVLRKGRSTKLNVASGGGEGLGSAEKNKHHHSL